MHGFSGGVKFIYSEKATNFCETSTVDLSYVVTVKSTLEISQNFVAFSEDMNFIPNDFFHVLHTKLLVLESRLQSAEPGNH